MYGASESDGTSQEPGSSETTRRIVPVRQLEAERELHREATGIQDTVQVDHRPTPPSQRLVIDVPTMTIVKILVILFAASIIQQIWPLITILAFSAMLAAALSPYLAVLERCGLRRSWALTTVALSVVLGFGALVALVVPSLVAQTRDLVSHSDDYVKSLQTLLSQHGIHQNLLNEWHQVPKHLGGMNQAAVQVVFTIFDSTVALVTVLFITLYLLSDQEGMKTFFVGLFPRDRRTDVLRILAELRRQIGGYVRGQLITSVLAALFSFVVLTIAQIPHSLTLAVYVGLADLVPLFGGLLGTVPAVLIALTISPLRAVIVLAGFIFYQQLENHIIVPRVYAKTMRVSSLVALVGLLVGARLLGMLGMLVALPVVAALPVILDFMGIHLRTGSRPLPETDPSRDLP